MDDEKSLNEDVVNLPLIPFVNAVFKVFCDEVNEFNALIFTDVDINPKLVICADELTTLLPLVSNEDVTDSKEFNLSLSNMFTLEVTASARVSNSIL
jgi:hypothetical protein